MTHYMKAMAFHSLLPLAMLSVPAFPAVNIPADDPAIRYSGRFDFTDPKQPSCDWPGCSIQARFSGASITVKLSGGDNDFNVFIDGEWKSKLTIDNAKTSYVAAAGLPAGAHTLLLTKRTEGFQGITTFSGLQLEDGQALSELPPRPGKRIQFIGDSFTVGYGDEANTLVCADRRPFDNNYAAYGPLTARALDAEYSVQAVSGLGMVHNYGDPVALSAQPMPPLYDQTLFGKAQPKWDMSKWVPDVIVVALGTNDFSTAVKPTEQQYASAYLAFLAKLRGWHPNAQILCVTYSVDNFQKAYVDSVVNRAAKAGDTRVHRVHMPALAASDLGCDYHPNVAGHQKYADVLIPVMRQYLGTTGTRKPPRGSQAAPGAKGTKGARETGMLPSGGVPLKAWESETGTEWVDARGRRLGFSVFPFPQPQ
jgi:lysophospholipase L1-like esterase